MHALGIALISFAAAEGVLLAAMAVVAVVTEGAAIPAMVGGFVAGGVIDAAIGIAYAAAVSDMADLQNQIAEVENQLSYLNAIEAQIDGFEKGLANTVTASQAVVDGWTALEDDLSNLTDQLDKISPEEAAIVITTQLHTANKHWGVVLQQARVLQPSGQIPVKNYKGMKSFLKDITPKQGA